MSNTVTFSSFPISSGKQPVRLLLTKTNSFSDFIWPTLEGTHPEKLLLAITTTVAGVDPMFSGILEEKRLLFKNIASKLLVKSFGGNSPSKLLNLMSMYLSSEISSTCSGNRPTKRLLLMSSS
ncbi:hypothetical protein V8G54_006106 [Vigna mungo]|uniref:Uncharacterized protein n=1 Tax=Vigna mungo TaxID=3915 RepID=A0AAQ3S7R2_VIGMU